MGWRTGTAPCQSNPAPRPGAIPETCPSGEEPPEATPHHQDAPEGNLHQGAGGKPPPKNN
jgi:hypothetical protein